MFRFYLTFYFLFSVNISFAQSTYIRVIGNGATDVYHDFFFTPDSGFIFPGINANEITITRRNSALDTLWSRQPSPGLSFLYSIDFSVLTDSRIAFTGRVNDEAVLMVTDTNAIITDSINYASGAWSLTGIKVIPRPDSGLVWVTYDDGYTCSNSYNLYSFDKNLAPQWTDYWGACDKWMVFADDFSPINSQLNCLRNHSPYYDGFNWIDDAPENIRITLNDSVAFDSLYLADEYFYLVRNTTDGGALLCGYIDTLGSLQIVLEKIDVNGMISWRTVNGDSHSDIPYDMIQTSDGGYAVFSNSFIPPASHPSDVKLKKFDSSGQLLWEKQFGTAQNESAIRIRQTSQGGFVMLASTDGFPGRMNMIIRTDSTGNVNSPYTIQQSASPCSSGSITLTVAPSGSSYLWNTGETTQSIIVNTNGNYEATVTDQFGNEFIIPFSSVYFAPSPYAIISTDTLVPLCNGNDTLLSVQYDPSYLYQWYFNNTITNNNSNSFLAATNGYYYCIVSNNCGSDTSQTVHCNFYPTPPAPAVSVYPSAHVCSGDSIMLVSNGNGNTVKWRWLSIEITGDTLILTIPNNYYLNVTLTSPIGCASAGTSMNVSVDNTPSINITSVNNHICSPGSDVIQYTSNYQYGLFYFFYNNVVTDTLTYHSNPGTWYADTAGTYAVIMSNSCGSDTAVTTVTSSPRPVITLYPALPVICSGQPVMISCLNQGIYQWSTQETTQFILISTPNSYSLSFTDSAGCTDYEYFQVTADSSLPVPPLNLGNDLILCPGQSVTLNTGTNLASCHWYPTNDSTFSITLNNNNSLTDTIIYIATIGNWQNCFNHDSITVIYDICNDIDNLASHSLKVYPNPSSGNIYFSFENNFSVINSVLVITDYTGRIVRSQIINDELIIVETSGLGNGIYLYSIINEKGISYSGKLELNK
jgi:hypothetical protein